MEDYACLPDRVTGRVKSRGRTARSILFIRAKIAVPIWRDGLLFCFFALFSHQPRKTSKRNSFKWAKTNREGRSHSRGKQNINAMKTDTSLIPSAPLVRERWVTEASSQLLLLCVKANVQSIMFFLMRKHFQLAFHLVARGSFLFLWK